MAASGTLFGANLPDGFHYRERFISTDDEQRLVSDIGRVEFSNFEMRGVVARRRVAFFGSSYDSGRAPSPPIPSFLLPIRDALASWAAVDPESFAMALINETGLVRRSDGTATRPSTTSLPEPRCCLHAA